MRNSNHRMKYWGEWKNAHKHCVSVWNKGFDEAIEFAKKETKA